MVDSIKSCGRTLRSLSIGSAVGSSQSSPGCEAAPSRWRRFSGSSVSTVGSETVCGDVIGVNGGVAKPKKLIRLKNLKHGGTTIRNDTGRYEFFYNPLEIGSNPYNTRSFNKDHGFSIELEIDPMSRNVYLPDLCIRGDNPSSPSRSSPVFASSSTALVPDEREGLQHDNGVAVSGKVKLTVTNQKKPIYVGAHCVKLKCFVHEYLCMVETRKKDNSAGKKTVKLCKDVPHENAHMLPYKEIEMDLLANYQTRCFGFGTYEFPFSFHLIDFPASTLSYFGKTFYRIESAVSVTKNPLSSSSVFDTVLLSDEIIVKRILSSANFSLKHESVSLQGHWNVHRVSYNVMLNSRLLEIGSPFGISIGLMKDRDSPEKFEKITISLSQSFSIPCVDSKTLELLPSTYSSKNEIELYQIDMESDAENFDETDSFQYYEVDNLKIPPSDKDYLCKSWLKPFYCEMNTKYKGRARLKIIHTLVIKLHMSRPEKPDSDNDDDTGSRRLICLNLNIPILLVDQDMANNLWLPPYNKTTPTTDRPLTEDLPVYYHGDTIQPPKYPSPNAD